MALTLDPAPPDAGPTGQGDAAAPLVEFAPAAAEATVVGRPQTVLPTGAVAPTPTGLCWCGSGKKVEDGAFFVARHAPGAAQRAIIKHFGSVEAFLALLGEEPSSD
jgi:hypothetical protein